MKKRQHLLRIESSAGDFEDLVRSARSNGHRVGRLILDDPPRIPELEDPSFLRTVAVGGGRSVAVKSIQGPPVLRDLLREHFAGCRLVLIAGEIEAPLLRRSESGWKIEAEGRVLTWTTEELVAALSRPQLFVRA